MSIFKTLFSSLQTKVFNFFFTPPYGFPKIIFEAYLKTTYSDINTPFCFIQVGANDGISYDTLFQFVTGRNQVKGIVIEPIKDYFDDLVQNYRLFPDIIPVNKAIHPTLKKIDMFRLAKNKENLSPEWAKGIASIYPKHHLKSQTPTAFIVNETVEAQTLMSVYTHFKARLGPIDLIQIDVEGFDRQIIKMIDFRQLTPQIIKYEHVNLSKIDYCRAYLHLQKSGYIIFNDGSDLIAIKK